MEPQVVSAVARSDAQRKIFKIAIVGAESTGKTVLCEHLANLWKTSWAPEFGRDYTVGLVERFGSLDNILWKPENFVEIGRGQLKLEQEMLSRANQVLFCDSTLLTTYIWSEFLVQTHHADLIASMVSHEREYDLYILMDVEGCPWIQDGARLAPETQWFHQRFRKELLGRHLPFMVVGGSSWVERTQNAENVISDFLKSNKDQNLASQPRT